MGGNLLLNVGPQPDGQLPPAFVERALKIGEWLDVHGEAIYGSDGGNLTEFITYGRQTMKDNKLYPHHPLLGWEAGAEAGGSGYAGIPGYAADNGQELSFRQEGDVLWIEGLPRNVRRSCSGHKH